MANSYLKVYVHYVFSTKNREPMILSSFEKELWAYIAGVSREINVDPIIINGVEDHVHFLASMPSTITIAEVMKKVKAVSSLWVNQTFMNMTNFEWQVGYGAFSVSHYDLNKTIEYIKNQKEHHKIHSFENEYIRLLKENDIEYNEKYLLG
jgi:putative transposase